MFAVWKVRAACAVVLLSLGACTASSDEDDANDGSGGMAAPVGTGGSASAISNLGGGGSGGAASSADMAGSGGMSGSGGVTGSGGMTGSGGVTGSGGTIADAGPSTLEKFSFFVVSYAALFDLAAKMGKPDGFGGDLTYGETGDGAGLRGADKICTAVAERSMPGSAVKVWHAFLSTSYANAIDRIGDGPWYDRRGRVFAMNKAALLSERPTGIDPTIALDLPNEDGTLNHDPDSTGEVDNHDMLTGSNAKGTFYDPDDTSRNCNDWTSTDPTIGRPRVGHSWTREMGGMFPGGAFPGGAFPGGMFPTGTGGMDMFPGNTDGIGVDGSFDNWISSLDEAGCAPGINLVQEGGPEVDTPTVGSGGGYGGFYCFALMP